MNNFLIVCGGRAAVDVISFRKTVDPKNQRRVHVFEPNPVFVPEYEKTPYNLHRQAVWVKDEDRKFYMTGGTKSRSGGCSLFEEAEPGGKFWIDVPCIDFDKWMFENFSKEDDILVRMDMEGAEYAVLRKMIESGTIKYINKLYVEFHHRRFPKVGSEQEYRFIVENIDIPFVEDKDSWVWDRAGQIRLEQS